MCLFSQYVFVPHSCDGMIWNLDHSRFLCTLAHITSMHGNPIHQDSVCCAGRRLFANNIMILASSDNVFVNIINVAYGQSPQCICGTHINFNKACRFT